MTQVHPEHSPNFSNAHGVVMLTETSKLLPWLMFCAMLSGTAVALAVFAIIWASLSAHETRQLQIQVMDQNALLIREGLAQPTDTTYGPAGNLEYKPHKPQEKK
jgi:hypothetical protein